MITTSAICQEGRNCWRIARARRAAFLVDAASYFQSFAEAAEKAERSIAILAWDINGKIRLRRDHKEETLRAFLVRLLDAKPQLHIYILNWDFPLLYAQERELLPMFDHAWQAHPRLHFVWDDRHPMGACHHQKVVVIDDRVAFVGGLDLTDERWDMPSHLGEDRRRHGVDQPYYTPFHDAMLLVEGEVAWHLGQLARERWRRADPRKRQVPAWALAPQSNASPWPESVTPDLENTDVAIARTEPAFLGRPAVHEVQQLFKDSLAAAEWLIYIENQYFTSRVVTNLVVERLQERDGPEIALVLPRGTNDWVEEASLGVLRWYHLREVLHHNPHGHLGAFYPRVPTADKDAYLKVHSKVMIIDDRFLRIGSANLCNRSMGMDTECDLVIEARREEEVASIRRFRYRLLAEHCNTTPEIFEAEAHGRASLLDVIRKNCGPRCLAPIELPKRPLWDSTALHHMLFDPEQPLEVDRLISREMRGRKKLGALSKLLRAGPIWFTYYVALPVLGFWILRKRMARAVWGFFKRCGH